MLDLRRLRSDHDAVRAALARRGDDAVAHLDRIVELDARQREVTQTRDELRARVKLLSKEVGQLRARGDMDEAEIKMAESRRCGDDEKRLDAAAEVLGAELRDLLLRTPNTAVASMPPMAPARPTTWCCAPRATTPMPTESISASPHWDIGAELDILDPERAVKISGPMFALYRGWGARLLRAMVQHSLDRNADAFEEIRPPTLVRTDTMISTGHLPKFEDEAYHVERDDLWAIPTAEVPLTSMHRDELLDEADLPRRYTAYTSCFRREAGRSRP